MSTEVSGKQGRLSLTTKIFFGFGDVYGGGALVVVGFFYLFFLTVVAGLSPGLAGMVFMIGKAWDAVSDPLMGFLSDRTRSKYGRRRVYFLAGIIPIVVTFFLLWTVPPFESQAGTFIYYVAATIAFNTVITMVMVPYNAIIPELTPDYSERSSLTGFRIAFSNSASLVAAALPPIIFEQFASPEMGYRTMGLIFGLFFALPWLGVFYFTYERKAEPAPAGFTLFSDAFDTMRNFSFRMLVGTYLITFLALDVIMAVMMFYLTYIVGIYGFGQSLVLGLLVLCQVLALLIFVPVSQKYGKRASYLAGAVVAFLMLPVLFFFHQGSPVWLIYLVACVVGAGTSGIVFSPWAMLPDVLDVDEMVTGKQRQGVYSGVMTFMRKISAALAIFIVGWIIDLTGFINPSAAGVIVQQPDSFLLAVRILVAFLPMLLILIGVYFARRYPVTAEHHRGVREVLEKHSAGEAGTFEQKAAALTEQLYSNRFTSLASHRSE